MYAILGEFTQAAFHLGQTMEQLDAFLDRELASGKLEHDRKDDPKLTVFQAHDALADAVEKTGELRVAFYKAQSALSGVSSREEDGTMRPVRRDDVAPAALNDDNADQSVSARGGFPAPIGDVLAGPEQGGPASGEARTDSAPKPRRCP